MKCKNCSGRGSIAIVRDRLINCGTCGGKGYKCPDNGICHHDCEDGGCFRVKACASFETDGSWDRFNLCPNGHPADGAPCVRYKCEHIGEVNG